MRSCRRLKRGVERTCGVRGLQAGVAGTSSRLAPYSWLDQGGRRARASPAFEPRPDVTASLPLHRSSCSREHGRLFVFVPHSAFLVKSWGEVVSHLASVAETGYIPAQT